MAAKVLKTGLLTASVLLAGAAILAHQLGRKFPVQEAPPRNIDAIFTFGMAPARYAYSESLWRDHADAEWFISDPLDYIGKRMLRRGIPSEKLAVVINRRNTYQEIEALDSLLHSRLGHANRKLEIALVSDDYHLLRIRMLANRHLDHSRYHFVFLAVPRTVPVNYWSHWFLHPQLRLEAVKQRFL